MSNKSAESSEHGSPRSAGSLRVRRVLVGMVVATVLFVLDVQQEPSRQMSAKVLVSAIEVYQATFSRALAASGANCRFEPTCSHYGHAAIEHYGTIGGVLKTSLRIGRCNPWTADGTVDLPYSGWSAPEVVSEVSE